MKVGIVGPQDFSVNGKYPDADAAAEEFVTGMVEALPRYSHIVGGGQEDGVDRWVRHAFDIYKDKRKLHLTEYPPQHRKDKYSDLDWTNRARAIIRESENLFVVLPEEFSAGPESEILQLARGSHIHHSIIRLTPRGDVSSAIEVRAKDTFIPVAVKTAASKEEETIDELPAGRDTSEQPSDGHPTKAKNPRRTASRTPAPRKRTTPKSLPFALKVGSHGKRKGKLTPKGGNKRVTRRSVPRSKKRNSNSAAGNKLIFSFKRR